MIAAQWEIRSVKRDICLIVWITTVSLDPDFLYDAGISAIREHLRQKHVADLSFIDANKFLHWVLFPIPENVTLDHIGLEYVVGLSSVNFSVLVGVNFSTINTFRRSIYKPCRFLPRDAAMQARSCESYSSIRLSVCHTRALWLMQRTYRRYFYTTWKGSPSSFRPPNSAWWARSPSTFNGRSKWPTPFKNR